MTSHSPHHRVSALLRHLQFPSNADCPIAPHPSSSSWSLPPFPPSLVVFSAPVLSALSSPSTSSLVVALESTIITHGMPYPQNLETARRVESTCRLHGGVPATIALLDGRIHVGLTDSELRHVAANASSAQKCSVRDVATAVATGVAVGSTTVGSTMFIAARCGIRMFVTGGIGGVHRDVLDTFDVSSDLVEMSRTPGIAVCCAGVKSILDIGRTLEALETGGVSVITIGQKEFPSFFTAKSAFVSPTQCDDLSKVARVLSVAHKLRTPAAQLIAVPVPEKLAAHGDTVERATTQALAECSQKGVRGNEVTPFLLKRINELTGGESLAANIELILHNVKVGTQIAVELNKLENAEGVEGDTEEKERRASGGVVVVGAANVDLVGRPHQHSSFLLGTSNNGYIIKSYGGVGRNIAETVGRMTHSMKEKYSIPCTFVSLIGKDPLGDGVLQHLNHECHLDDVTHVKQLPSPPHSTSIYSAILDHNGGLITTIADMKIMDSMTLNHVPANVLRSSPLCILDGNLPPSLFQSLVDLTHSHRVALMFDPTSVEKSTRGLKGLLSGRIKFVTPDSREWMHLVHSVKESTSDTSKEASVRSEVPLEAVASPSSLSHVLSPKEIADSIAFFFRRLNPSSSSLYVILKLGSSGAIVASLHSPSNRISVYTIPTIPQRDSQLTIRNVTGAGDTMVGTVATRLMKWQRDNIGKDIIDLDDDEVVLEAVEWGMRAAEMAIQRDETIPKDISDTSVGECVRMWHSAHVGGIKKNVVVWREQ